MGWIDILCVVIVVLVTLSITAYLLWRKITGRGSDCASHHMSGQNLVKMYHKKYDKKKVRREGE